MKRNRIVLLVEIDLDSVPGTMHTPGNARQLVEASLRVHLENYRPTVEVTAHEALS